MLRGLDESERAGEQQAQELAYEAMDAPTWQARMRLAVRALALDPENVDALLMTADVADVPDAARIAMLRGIVAIGERRLGTKAFEDLVPHFWGFLETRPYMRARHRLAAELHRAGRLDEAAQEYAEMLVLNESDNQGVRYELLPVLLAAGRLDDARALIKRFKDEGDYSVVFAWGRVLERVLSGESAAAARALKVARKQNAHMELYLNGQRKLPKNLPGSYSPGSREEAQCYGDILAAAWKAHPAALDWLCKQAKDA